MYSQNHKKCMKENNTLQNRDIIKSWVDISSSCLALPSASSYHKNSFTQRCERIRSLTFKTYENESFPSPNHIQSRFRYWRSQGFYLNRFESTMDTKSNHQKQGRVVPDIQLFTIHYSYSLVPMLLQPFVCLQIPMFNIAAEHIF